MTRRAAAALLALALAACSDDGRIPVVVYSPHGPDILREFEAAFEARRPDVDVRPLNLPSGEILTRVRGEAGNPQADVWWGAPSATLARAAEEGLLAPYRPTWRDALDARYAGFAGPGDAYMPHFVLPHVILYNRDRMTADAAPRGWRELAAPEWAARVVLRFPLPSGSMRAALAWLIAWPGEADGFAWLADLHRNVKRYAANPTELFEAVKRDADAVVSIWNLTDVLFQRDRYGYPFGVRVPEEGVPIVVDCIALIARRDADPRRTEAARAFYEFATSPEMAVPLMREHFRILPRTDLDPATIPAWVAEHPFTPLPVDPAVPAAREDAWMTRYDAEVKPLARRERP